MLYVDAERTVRGGSLDYTEVYLCCHDLSEALHGVCWGMTADYFGWSVSYSDPLRPERLDRWKTLPQVIRHQFTLWLLDQARPWGCVLPWEVAS